MTQPIDETTFQFLRRVELQRDKVENFEVYPFSIPAVRQLRSQSLHPNVTFLVGENGAGKSTFVEAIAVMAGFNAEGGSKNFTGSFRPSESNLSDYLRLVRGARRERTGFFLRAETMFNVSTEAEEYVESRWAMLHERSHGEAFMWVMLNKFSPKGLYILDEPESALSPQRQLAFLIRMHDLITQGSQFIIATHSPILMAYPRAAILELSDQGVRHIGYEDTEHYQITRDFLHNPARVLPDIFE